MQVGDLVVAKFDEARGLQCIGIIVDARPETDDVKILWSSATSPVGWWTKSALRLLDLPACKPDAHLV